MIRVIKLLKKGVPAALFFLTVLMVIFQPCPRLATAARVPIADPEHHLLPFYLNGKTYLLGLTPPSSTSLGARDNAAKWWVIEDDPKDGLTLVVQGAKMSSEYKHLTSFALNNHTYIFGLHVGVQPILYGVERSGVGANIWRINDDAKGFELVKFKGEMSHRYKHVVSFQLKGEPYILGLHEELGANIWRIKDDGSKGLTFNLVKYKAKMASKYMHLAVFYMEGHPYIFGVHADVGANIWRIKDDPSQGFDLVMKGAKFPRWPGYEFVRPFHVGGRPYLFAAVSHPGYVHVPGDVLELGVAIGEGLFRSDWSGIYEPGKGFGVIWEIGGDPRRPSIRQITTKAIRISERYENLITFEQGGKAYIFGVHEEKYANIWRVNDDPARGFTLDYYGRNK
jgi:hypothetical protein